MKIFVFLVFFLVVEYITSREFDAVILGSGISGMSTASFIAQGGKKVAIIEQCPNFGGSLQTFNRTGKSGMTFSFEPGMHYVLDYGSISFSAIAGREITMTPMRPYTDMVIYNSNSTARYNIPDYPEFIDFVKKTFPDEADNIQKFFDTVKSTTDYKLKMGDLLDQTTKNPRLRFMLCYMEYLVQYPKGPYNVYSGKDQFPVIEYKNLLEGVLGQVDGYPAGGSRHIIEGVIKQIEKQGGEIFTGCRAEKLLLDENGTVTGVDTQCGSFTSNFVISTMNAPNTFNDQFIDASVLEKYGYPKKIAALTPSYTAMIYFLGFNESNDILKFPTANIWYYNDNPTYSNNNNNNDETEIDTLFGSCLSCRDTEYPKDRTNMFFLQPIEYELFAKWNETKTHERPQDYYAYKDKFLKSLLSKFYELYPIAEDYLDVTVVSSPLTIRDFLNHPNGEIYGSSWADDTQDWVSMTTPIQGLYCAGQDVSFTGVFPNTLSGMELGVIVLEDMGKSGK